MWKQILIIGLLLFCGSAAQDSREAGYRITLKHNPRDVGSLEGLAELALDDGRFDEAAELFKRAIEATHPNGAAIQLMDQLFRYREDLGYSAKQVAEGLCNAERPASIHSSGNGRDARAELIHNVKALYPESARQLQLQGTVLLQIVVGKDGHVEKIVPVSGHPLLRGPAIEAVQQWIYRPVLSCGPPVEIVNTAYVSFTPY